MDRSDESSGRRSTGDREADDRNPSSHRNDLVVYWLDLEELVPAGSDYSCRSCSSSAILLASAGRSGYSRRAGIRCGWKTFSRSFSTGSACPTAWPSVRATSGTTTPGRYFPRTTGWESAFSALIGMGRKSSLLWRARSSFALPRRGSAPRSRSRRGLVNTALRIVAAEEDRSPALRARPRCGLFFSMHRLADVEFHMGTAGLPGRLRRGDPP